MANLRSSIPLNDLVQVSISRSSRSNTTANSASKGDKGDRGYSAYEIAVQHGFLGTESEWLASLVPQITIRIGAVTVGDTPAASVTQEGNTFTFDFVLPKCDCNCDHSGIDLDNGVWDSGDLDEGAPIYDAVYDGGDWDVGVPVYTLVNDAGDLDSGNLAA